MKITIHLVRNTIILNCTIDTQQTNNQTNISQKHSTWHSHKPRSGQR